MRAEQFRNVTLKVNQTEADAACRRAFAEVDYERLRRSVGARRLFVTRGSDPTIVHDEGRVILVPVRRVGKPVDICGAGDAFSSGAACALALGASPEQAAEARQPGGFRHDHEARHGRRQFRGTRIQPRRGSLLTGGS